MTDVLTRLKNVVMAEINELLAKKEKDHPIALLNQYLRECEQETEKVKKLIDRQRTLVEEFSKEYSHAAEMLEKRKRQALIAEEAKETELTQLCLREAAFFEEREGRLKKSLEEAKNELLSLEAKHEEMKHRLKDMHLRRLELMGRENVTRATHRMNKVLNHDLNDDNKGNSPFGEIDSYFKRLENQVNKAYYAHAIDEKIIELEKKLKEKNSPTN